MQLVIVFIDTVAQLSLSIPGDGKICLTELTNKEEFYSVLFNILQCTSSFCVNAYVATMIVRFGDPEYKKGTENLFKNIFKKLLASNEPRHSL